MPFGKGTHGVCAHLALRFLGETGCFDGLTSTQRSIIRKILDHNNSKEPCSWIAQDTLARELRVHGSTVKVAVRRARQLGFMTVIQTRQCTGLGGSRVECCPHFWTRGDLESFASARQTELPSWMWDQLYRAQLAAKGNTAGDGEASFSRERIISCQGADHTLPGSARHPAWGMNTTGQGETMPPNQEVNPEPNLKVNAEGNQAYEPGGSGDGGEPDGSGVVVIDVTVAENAAFEQVMYLDESEVPPDEVFEGSLLSAMWAAKRIREREGDRRERGVHWRYRTARALLPLVTEHGTQDFLDTVEWICFSSKAWSKRVASAPDLGEFMFKHWVPMHATRVRYRESTKRKIAARRAKERR